MDNPEKTKKPPFPVPCSTVLSHVVYLFVPATQKMIYKKINKKKRLKKNDRKAKYKETTQRYVSE